MKKNIIKLSLILFIVLDIYPLKGQEYSPLLEEGRTWNILENTWSGTIFGGTYKTRTIACMGDSIIDGVTYKKLYSSFEENPVNWSLTFLAREDDSMKVWKRNTVLNIDRLVYDFSLSVGDMATFHWWSYEDPYTMIVDSISEIIINGTPRKQIWFMPTGAHPVLKEAWIEGIGSNLGLIYSGLMGVVGGWYGLLCVSENDNSIYKTDLENFYGCYYVYNGPGSTIENEKQDILIYPNPASDKVTVEGDNIKTITVYNIIGQEIEIIKVDNEAKKDITISSYENGVYIFRINTTEGNIFQKRIIIAR